MKSMGLPLAAIFFMTYFYRAGRAMVPSPPPPPPDALLRKLDNPVVSNLFKIDQP